MVSRLSEKSCDNLIGCNLKIPKITLALSFLDSALFVKAVHKIRARSHIEANIIFENAEKPFQELGMPSLPKILLLA